MLGVAYLLSCDDRVQTYYVMIVCKPTTVTATDGTELAIVQMLLCACWRYGKSLPRQQCCEIVAPCAIIITLRPSAAALVMIGGLLLPKDSTCWAPAASANGSSHQMGSAASANGSSHQNLLPMNAPRRRDVTCLETMSREFTVISR